MIYLDHKSWLIYDQFSGRMQVVRDGAFVSHGCEFVLIFSPRTTAGHRGETIKTVSTAMGRGEELQEGS